MDDVNSRPARFWNANATIAAIGVLPAIFTAYVGYNQGTKSTPQEITQTELDKKTFNLEDDLDAKFSRLDYPNYGISLSIPSSWQVEDGPALMAGGEFSVIKRYDEGKASIGLNFRLRPIQNNYIDHPEAQLRNQLAVYKKTYKSVSLDKTNISGIPANIFKFIAPAGGKSMDVRTYWVKLTPNAFLHITSAQYTDARDKDEFWEESDRIISSLVIATESWNDRYQTYRKVRAKL